MSLTFHNGGSVPNDGRSCLRADPALEKATTRRVQRFFWGLAVVFGLLQAWTGRMTLANDTVSYLDMGDYIWHGQWSLAINGLWNPMFAIFLGGIMALFRPSWYYEYPLVHAFLFLVFLATLACFAFFLNELILFRRENETAAELSIPAWVWQSLGYTMFLWSSLQLIGVAETNPDMIVAAWFFLACGLLIRIHRGAGGWITHLAARV